MDNIVRTMRFEWDEEKNRINRRKHKISFETAVQAFHDPHALAILDRVVNQEERWLTIGSVGPLIILVVTHTVREDDDEVILIISARKATPRERAIYGQNI